MSRRSRPRRPASLSESVRQQLSVYALAASAAGVGVLALAQPAEGRIVYTKAHHSIGRGSSYNLDLNHDGITDFTISVTYHCPQTCVSAVLARPAKGTGGVEGHHSRNGSDWAYALKAGVRIGPKRPFSAKY